MKILNLLERNKGNEFTKVDVGNGKPVKELALPANWIECLRLLVANERNGELAGLDGGEYLAAEAILGFAEVDSSFEPSPLVASLLAGILGKAAQRAD